MGFENQPKRRHSKIIAVQGISGGVGATNFAVNLAWELSCSNIDTHSRVCIIDLDAQGGSVAHYLGDRKPHSSLSDIATFGHTFGDGQFLPVEIVSDRLIVIPSPQHLAPKEIFTLTSIKSLIKRISVRYDYIIIDLGSDYTSWWEQLSLTVDTLFLVLQRDIRSSVNLRRLCDEIRNSPDIYMKCRLILTRAAGRYDFAERRREQLALSDLDIGSIDRIPDGGTWISIANDLGQPLARARPRSPYLTAIRKLVERLQTELHET